MATRIFSADRVDLTLHQLGPGNLLIDIEGRVTSSGWSNPVLRPRNGTGVPSDGVLGFDVLADPPSPGLTVLPVTMRIHAQHVIEGADSAEFWGPGAPLTGVRCYSEANAKTALLEPALGMPRMRVLQNPETAANAGDGPGFTRDILPLFRAIDIRAMRAVRNLDLSAHEDVSAHADLIRERL